jgi:glycosyltransferase involved in cell wall biosynthesis
MKILHLTTFLQGGAGRVVVDLITEQRRAQHDVALITSRTGAPGYGHYPAYLEALYRLDVSVQFVDSLFTREPAANLAVVRALDARFPPGAEPAVLHAHAAVPSHIALTFAGARRRPLAIVQTMHGWGVNKSPAQTAADIAVMNLVDRVAVPSRHAADLLAGLGVGPRRTTVVPYGISPLPASRDTRDDDALVEIDRARRHGAFVLACVGTIGPRKNQRLLVEALALVPRHVALHCVFVGDGDADGLRAAAESAGVAHRIQVLGYRPAARQIAALADALVLPSESEGQPLAVLEAFLDGTLVVVSDIPELTELVVHDQTGLTFPAGNAAALADTLARLVSLPEPLRQAMRAQARAQHLNTVAGMALRYQELYARAIDAGAGSRPRISPAA